MNIIFKRLTIHNFKSHADLTVNFGSITRITGENAHGKSSIGEGPTFILYGVDMMGTKLDPTPIGYKFDHVRADLLLSVDDKDLLLSRAIEKGKNAFFVNEVPSKATEFEDLIKSLFDKDLFLSLWNPSYFPSLKWDEQRAMILRYVSAPANKEVFKAMVPAQSDKLAELTKKHSLEDLDKIHRDNKTKQDKAYIAAQSRTKTLQEQLSSIKTEPIDKEASIKRIAELDSLIEAHNNNYAHAANIRFRIQTAESEYKRLTQQIQNIKDAYTTKKEQQPNDTCHTCGQSLPNEAKEKAISSHNELLTSMRKQHNDLLEVAKAVKGQYESLTSTEPVDLPDISDLHEEKAKLQRALQSFDIKSNLEQQIEQAKTAEAETLKSRNDSIFILDAIKEFNAKSAELQAAKVQSLFTSLSLKLTEQQKNGEIKNTFEIEYDGRPYRKLSLSESIRAGLELRDVLSEQSGIVAPVFVDNQESITNFKSPIGQLIVSRVVAGQELKIESEDA